jgi:hypothetical protein
MAILDNILPTGAYGIRYELAYKNRTDNDIRLRIWERDYEDAPDDLTATGTDVVLNLSFADGDFFRPVAGTQIDLSLYAMTTDQYKDFRYADNRKYFVTLEQDTVVMGWGYLMPETYEQDWGSLPDVVRITATDGLGVLKDLPFENNDGEAIRTIERGSDIITFLLYKAGLPSTYTWFDTIDVRPSESETPANGCLYNVYFECERFVGMTCGEVLTEILETFNAQVVQYKTGYLIRHIDTEAFLDGVQYLSSGDVESPGYVFDDDYTIPTHGRYAGRVVMQNETPVKEVNIEYKRELIKSLIQHDRIEIVSDNATWIANTQIGYNTEGDLSSLFIYMPPTPVTTGKVLFHLEKYPDPVTEDGIPIEFGELLVKFKVRNIQAISPLSGTCPFGWFFGLDFGKYWSCDHCWLAADCEDKLDQINDASNQFVFGIQMNDSTFPLPVNIIRTSQISGYDVDMSVTAYFGLDPCKQLFLSLNAVDQDSGGLSAGILITDIQITYPFTTPDNEIQVTDGSHIETIPINENNQKTVDVVKSYEHNSLPTPGHPFNLFASRSPYIFQNNMYCKPGADYVLTDDSGWIQITTLIGVPLHEFIKAKYNQFYSLTKSRVQGAIWDAGTAKMFPYQNIIDPAMDQIMKINSLSWQPKNNYYEVEMIGFKQADAESVESEGVLDAVLDFNLHF